MHRQLLFTLPVILLFTVAAHARLGETEAQSQARYGEPRPELIGPGDKPLIPGAKEIAYFFQGWRIRAAFVGRVTHKIEYAKLDENGASTLDESLVAAILKSGGPKKLKPEEVERILDAEKGQPQFRWREQKPRTGNKDLNTLATAFKGRVWERSDHAQAKLWLDLVVVLESRDAEKLAKQLGKPAPTPMPGPGGAMTATPRPTPSLPKF